MCRKQKHSRRIRHSAKAEKTFSRLSRRWNEEEIEKNSSRVQVHIRLVWRGKLFSLFAHSSLWFSQSRVELKLQQRTEKYFPPSFKWKSLVEEVASLAIVKSFGSSAIFASDFFLQKVRWRGRRSRGSQVNWTESSIDEKRIDKWEICRTNLNSISSARSSSHRIRSDKSSATSSTPFEDDLRRRIYWSSRE